VGIGTDTGEIPDCFGPEGRSLATPFVLDVPEGNEKEFILRFAARDAGGNTVYNETLYRLEVDRNPPPAPTPFPKSLIYTPEDISIASPGDGTDYLYGFGDLSREGGEVGRFRTIEEELLLRAEDGKVREYVISLKARDRAGNVSPETSIYRVVVDKDPPMKCALQYSLTEMGAEGYLLEWYGRGENDSTTPLTGRMISGGTPVPWRYRSNSSRRIPPCEKFPSTSWTLRGIGERRIESCWSNHLGNCRLPESAASKTGVYTLKRYASR
jgi:hypothetical protein